LGSICIEAALEKGAKIADGYDRRGESKVVLQHRAVHVIRRRCSSLTDARVLSGKGAAGHCNFSPLLVAFCYNNFM
jgi:hypothetical protein